MASLRTRSKSAGEVGHLVAEALAHAPVSMLITTPNGRIVYVNPEFERVTGYPADEVLGQTPRVLKSGQVSSETYASMWTALRAGLAWQGEIVNRRKDGDTYTAALSISPVRDADGVVTHFVGSHRDVTRECALRAELEERVWDAARGDLIATVAHDLKNPLGNIVSYTDLILATQDLSPKATHDLTRIRENGLFMFELIHDILDTQRIDTGKLKVTLAQNDVRNLVTAAVERSAFLAADKGITLRSNVPYAPLSALVDARKVAQVLNNLVSNALKFSPKGSAVEVGARAHDAGVEIWVRDAGCGIAQAELPLLFKKFSRASTRAIHGEKSTGLGLYIAHEIVKMHGGEIAVQSSPGHGSTFSFVLRAA